MAMADDCSLRAPLRRRNRGLAVVHGAGARAGARSGMGIARCGPCRQRPLRGQRRRAFAASFSDPFGVAAARDGSIYIADAGDAQRIRRIGADGTVSTFAGGGLGYADGRGTAARFSTPSGIALTGDGVLYVADTGNNAIRRITPEGIVSTVAGGVSPGYVDGTAAAARFNGPVGVAVDSAGRVLVADTYNDRIRAVQPDGTVITVAGSVGSGYADGPAAAARFDSPCGVSVDGRGTIYVADSGNGLVRSISPDGIVNTIGPLPGDGLFRPIGIAATERWDRLCHGRSRTARRNHTRRRCASGRRFTPRVRRRRR